MKESLIYNNGEYLTEEEKLYIRNIHAKAITRPLDFIYIRNIHAKAITRYIYQKHSC